MPSNFTQDGFLKFVCMLPPVAAGDATIEYPILHFFNSERTSGQARLMKVSVVAQALVTGDDTDRKNLNVINKGADGTGTTELGNRDLTTGINLGAMNNVVVYESTANDGHGDLIDSDGVIALQIEQVASGVAIPALMVTAEYEVGGIEDLP